MVHRPTMDEVRPVADAFLTASADEASPEDAVALALRLGGGTREGQAHVNLMLVHLFADILERECPTQWRTLWGVPDVAKINALAEEPDPVERYARQKANAGRPVSTADVKARVTNAVNADVLARKFLQVRRQQPERLGEFSAAAEGATGIMVDLVWGALWIACGKVRERAGKPTTD
ncbi:hypothetical protein FE633_11500 [Streptomyces montanus]|uniref:Uncharacterized protein n=1 Tax=Streptomyces montanus TaxID=2580423 RepID=A0A5R9FZI9_9ACTN|nr:hypothetical protein [Streptomyces montanus]TLS46153.1 hypothetical protein FE633_11500 [Streptomyces montanus]